MDFNMLNRAYDSYFKSTKTSAAEEALFKSNFNTLDAFIQSHDVDFSKTPANDTIVKNAESKLGVKFGPQLYKYLTQYGYLGYEHVEFHGITKQQGLNSDMVKDTLKVHKLSSDTKNMVVIENQGEGDYFLVDSKDKVYEFDINMGKVVPTKYSLFRYIEYRFNLATSMKKKVTIGAAVGAANQNKINNQMINDMMMQDHQRFMREQQRLINQIEMDNLTRNQNQIMMNQMHHFM